MRKKVDFQIDSEQRPDLDIIKEHFGNDFASALKGVDAGRSVPQPAPPAPVSISGFFQSLDYFIPESCKDDAENYRKATLLAGFGFLGAFFGLIFGSLFSVFEHYEGAKIIGLSSLIFLIIPWLLKNAAGPVRLGNLYLLVLLGGFLSLCWVGGGVRSFAFAWLVSVPLCAILLTGSHYAIFWTTMTLLAVLILSGCEYLGMTPPVQYPAKWHILITAFGYAGLAGFMALLGLLFERGRKRSSGQMHLALDEFQEMNGRLQNLNQEKNEFLKIVAHDLKNPLTVILGISELLPRIAQASPEKISDFAGKISQESKRMRDLIVNLLNLKAIEEGRTVFKMEPLELIPLVDRTVENFCGIASKKRIRLDFLPCKLKSKVTGDSQIILQVLDNLVSNAIKFSEPETTVTVRLHALEEKVRVEVRDEGPGISPEDQARLFERFNCLSNKPTGGENSTGLGLSIVKCLATAMGGNIWCESRVRKGTSFFFELPKNDSSLS